MYSEKIRIIPKLEIKNEFLIKGIRCEGLRKIGNPNKHALSYYKAGVDELLFMDCVASLYGRNNLAEVIKKAAENVFIPITVGGGIRNVEDADELLHNGADKICINTKIVEELDLPPVKIHCSVLAEDAIKAAIDNFRAKA